MKKLWLAPILVISLLMPSISSQAQTPTPTATNYPPSGWEVCEITDAAYDQSACIVRVNRQHPPHPEPPVAGLPLDEDEALSLYGWALNDVHMSHCTSVGAGGWFLPDDYIATCLDAQATPTATPTGIPPTEPATATATPTLVGTVESQVTPVIVATSTPHQTLVTPTPPPTSLDPIGEPPGLLRYYLPVIARN